MNVSITDAIHALSGLRRVSSAQFEMYKTKLKLATIYTHLLIRRNLFFGLQRIKTRETIYDCIVATIH